MTYENILPGIFIDRPNRFIAHVEIAGQVNICHVKNTGRCRELLLPGSRVFVQRAANPERKTKYDLISVYKGDTLVNIDSAAPNQVFHEWIAASGHWGKPTLIKPESRKLFVEVKGVTLEQNGIARFPDAPTERGVKHLLELAACQREGYHAAIAFIIQMKGVHLFQPNDSTHARFGEVLREATAQGVELLAMDCSVTPESLSVDAFIPADLTR